MTRLLPRPQDPGRYLTWYLWFSAVAMSVLVTIVVLLVFQNRSATAAQQRAAYSSCVSGNATRHETGRILDEIIGLPAVSHPQFQVPAEARIQAAQAAQVTHDIAVNYGKTNACGRP
jgi:hypothetical protein